ncbi:MAG TPA: glycoside hydrolase family 2 TIM barrel-domain containing protein, partial [Ruminococcus flavefaciens]|nr:glycoside hydrolase family 2 TIM barrel-domain containing protein [Ruminococcus flavefaciens]
EDTKAELFLERTRQTKLWVNGDYIGERNSLCTPHIYDITDHIKDGTAEICVMVSNTGYPTKGGHMTSEDTQTNWNGITGRIALRISEKNGISFIRTYPCISSHSVKLEFGLEGMDEAEISIWGVSSACDVVDTTVRKISADSPFTVIDLGEDFSLWDEYSPVIYTLKAAVNGSMDIHTVCFGMREFRADGMHFSVNGKPAFLRGKHDGMLFPLTGAAPATVGEWYEVLRKAKEWGINHYRFHTCCPPDAAFTAADMLGIYMQPELPFWGTIRFHDEEGYNADEIEYLREEGRRILRTFGNHPSFVMMSLGNELWGDYELMDHILAEYKAMDDRHLYTQGSNNFQFCPRILENDDFF